MRSPLLQPDIRPSRRLFWLLGAVVFLTAFGLRLATQHGAFHPDDSPETTLAGATLGIQHPPGYPLYTLLTRLAVQSLPGNPAYQAAGQAAFLSALVALLALKLGSEMLKSEAEAWDASKTLLAAALALGLISQPQLWFQGLSAKGGIYGLNLLLTLACAGLFWAGRDGKHPKHLRLAVLLSGLAGANHYMSFVLFAPAFFYWSWRAHPKLRAQAKLALWLLPGLSLYLYLPLRAAHEPFLNWGDPQTWARFWDTILRSQYVAAETARNWNKPIELARHFWQLLPGELSWHGMALALWGLRTLWIKQISWRPLWVCLGLHLIIVLAYNNPPLPWVINAFFLPDFVLLWIAVAAGGFEALRWAQSRHPQGALALGAAALLGTLLLLPGRYRQNDYSHDFLLYDYNRDLQIGLAADSALLASGGNDAFGQWYLQGIEGRRRDVSVVDVPLLGPWYIEQLHERLPELDPAWQPQQVVEGLLSAPKRPLYYSSHNPGDRGIPLGLVSLVPPRGMQVPLSVDGLLGRFKALRLRWVADATTPMDGNREELLQYYEQSANALAQFGLRQNVGPVTDGAMLWAQRFQRSVPGMKP